MWVHVVFCEEAVCVYGVYSSVKSAEEAIEIFKEDERNFLGRVSTYYYISYPLEDQMKLRKCSMTQLER